MTLAAAAALALAIAAVAFLLGYRRAATMRGVERLHSLPVYHGAYAALWCALPALLILAIWAPVQSRLVNQTVLSSPEGQSLPDFDMQRDAILSEAREIASGDREAGFNPESSALAPRFKAAQNRYAAIG